MDETISEFVKKTKIELDNFENYWNDKTGNDNFPEKLSPVEWEEQFVMFVSINKTNKENEIM